MEHPSYIAPQATPTSKSKSTSVLLPLIVRCAYERVSPTLAQPWVLFIFKRAPKPQALMGG